MDMQRAAELAVRRGIEFLLKEQDDDGMWRDFMTPAGKASCWPTGFILSAARTAAADHTSFSLAARALVARQKADGGWGYNEDTPSDADSTSWAALALSNHPFKFGDAIPRAAAFLRRHQRRDGGIATYDKAGPIRRYTALPRWLPFRGWCGSTVEVSATASRALRAIDLPSTNDLAWRYILSRQRLDGSWGAYWWTTPHVATEQAVALGASLGDTGTIERAAKWAVRILDRDGPAFNIALCLSIVVNATPRDLETINHMTDMLQHRQLADGSWPSVRTLRVPMPADTTVSDNRGWRPIRFDGGLEVADQQRTFTTATCIAALVRASDALNGARQ
jgi:squalene cyclase